jgi:hypothetical protein
METGMEFSDRVPANEPLSLVIFVLYCPGVDTRHCQEWPAYFARFTQGSRRLTFFPSQGRAARASADFAELRLPLRRRSQDKRSIATGIPGGLLRLRRWGVEKFFRCLWHRESAPRGWKLPASHRYEIGGS